MSMAERTDSERMRDAIADELHRTYCCTAKPRDGTGRVEQCATVADRIVALLDATQEQGDAG